MALFFMQGKKNQMSKLRHGKAVPFSSSPTWIFPWMPIVKHKVLMEYFVLVKKMESQCSRNLEPVTKIKLRLAKYCRLKLDTPLPHGIAFPTPAF